MKHLFLSPYALQAYFENVLFGQSMRAIGTAQGCAPSNVLRSRIRVVENARDVPEFDDLIQRLETFILSQPMPPRGPVSRELVLRALGLDARKFSVTIAKVIPVLSKSDAIVLSGDAPRAAILAKNVAGESLSREEFLAAVAFGWLEVAGPTDRRIRRFKLTLRAEEATVSLDSVKGLLANEKPQERPARKMGWSHSCPLEACSRRSGQTLITDKHVKTKGRFQSIYLTRNAVDPGAYAAISDALPPRLMTVLEEVCGKNTGFEVVEKGMGIPARSAKVLVAAALETLDHAGLLS
ncbi:DUF6456 domain-containing protein [Pelagimonas varians]|uniref:DUF6456 domain-containing protein n=1 Tax=Pelagimonas varians TaxID=696760 RepID=A0A238KG10_9RHOB|nr:DUF6456 domain-containing protein [Pelagimonas varians]PYG32399.1 hypothetical protein C8N36_103148 [Pelagimonas varians]SMX41454.1 hypothetical protein PEV8663_02281 [Pelagimonas varians]